MYFGHPTNTYNTQFEHHLIDCIQKEFPELEIENPNQPCHQEGYQRFKKEKGNGMQYLFQEVLPNMRAGTFLPFEDGMWGAGVYKEAKFIREEGKRIYEISWSGIITDMTLDKSKVLSVEETKERVNG